MYENIVIQALLKNKFIFQIRKLNNRKWIESFGGIKVGDF